MLRYYNNYPYLNFGNIQKLFSTTVKDFSKSIILHRQVDSILCRTAHVNYGRTPHHFFSVLSAFFFLTNIPLKTTCSHWPSVMFLGFFVVLSKVRFTGIHLYHETM